MKRSYRALALIVSLLLAPAAWTGAHAEAGGGGEPGTVLITGANRGIGLEFVRQYAARGWRVIATTRDPASAAELAALAADRDNIVIEPLDVLDHAGIDALAQKYSGQPIDVLINNAGFNVNRPMLDMTDDETARIMAVNLEAPRRMIAAVLPDMLERRRGHVINIASIAARFGPWGHAAYAAAKAGLIATTQSLACEHPHAATGVHFSYVNPGIVDTEFFDDPTYNPTAPARRRHVVSAARVARRIVRLLDRPRLSLYVPRYYRMLDLIAAISPDLALRLVRRHSQPPVVRPPAAQVDGAAERQTAAAPSQR